MNPQLPAARQPGAAPAATDPRLVVLGQQPYTAETRIEQLVGVLTPTGAFYKRNHFPIPQLDAATWRLEVVGAVERPLPFVLRLLVAGGRLRAVLRAARVDELAVEVVVAGVARRIGRSLDLREQEPGSAPARRPPYTNEISFSNLHRSIGLEEATT